MPYWRGEKKYVLKVKARHLEENDKNTGVATITLKKYNYEQITGYFVNQIKFE